MKFKFSRRAYFFVEGDVLSLQNKLIMQGIKCITAEIKTPYPAKGIAFVGRQMDKALTALGIDRNEVHQIPTNDKGLILLSKYGVIIESESNLEELFDYYELILDFAKKHNLLVYLSNPHGDPSPVNNRPNTLAIRFWSMPAHSRWRKIKSVFEIELDDHQSDALEVAGITNLLIDSNNIAVAGLLENTLYVFFDLPDGENTSEILSEILSRYDELRLTPEEKKQREEARRQALLSSFAADYIKACTDRYKGQAKTTDDALARIATDINTLTSKLAKAISDQKILFVTKQAIDRLGGDYSAIFETELKRLQESSKISKLLVDTDALWVETVVLCTPEDSDGKSWELGAYQIIVSFNNSTMPKVSNLTRHIDGDSHPYDTGGGNLCYGNVTTSITQYLASQEYSFVVDAVINFLEYSPLSYGDMQGWPEVQKA